MFAIITLTISLLIVCGMVVYQIDAQRLGHNPQEIVKRFPELRILQKAREGIQSLVYTVGIRIFKSIYRLRKKFKIHKKNN